MNIADISRKLSSAKILGLGESSHGTHEFFELKTEIFKELVVNHGFNTLLFEDSQSVCASIDKFISTGEGNIDEQMQRLYSVWRVNELKQLIIWLRENYKTHKVNFVGFDINQSENNLQKRDELMANNIKKYAEDNPRTKAMVWAHNSHIQTNSSNFNQKPMGMFLSKYFGTNYTAVALLFGKGTVSATKLKMDAEPSKDRTLSKITIDSIPSGLAEHTLQSVSSEPCFLTKKEISKLDGDLSAVRSIGWGLVPELVNKIVEQTDIRNAFDSIIYFPKSTASQTFQQKTSLS